MSGRPSGPIGPRWSSGSWPDTTWESNTWYPASGVVPDVVGLEQSPAIDQIEDAGFTALVQTDYSAIVPIGVVISQSPVGGSVLGPGGIVIIVVSLGPQPASGTWAGQGPRYVWGWNYRSVYRLN